MQTKFVSSRSARPFPAVVSSGRRSIVVSAHQRVEANAEIASNRRQALLAGAALLSFLPTYASQAALCIDADTETAGDECRAAALAKDQVSGSAYGNITAAEGSAQRASVVTGVPVSVLDDKYTQATLALKATIDAYATLDVYDKSRPALIKQLKGDAATWVSKYAPGGSARKLSARRMYVAVDAVMGHIANAGLAPLPGGKFKVVEASMKDAVAFLADGR